MLASMTGYGNGTSARDGIAVTAEMRSVNNRYFEFSARLPRSAQHREGELKERVRARLARGKVTITIAVERTEAAVAQYVNLQAARNWSTVLSRMRDELGVGGDVTLDTLLRFPDVLSVEEPALTGEEEWKMVLEAVDEAVDMLIGMREREGAELTRDLLARLDLMEERLARIEELSRARSDVERKRLRERVERLLAPGEADPQRLELEIVLLADKLDITEEIVRFRSHTAFFRDSLASSESGGRALGFLLQEMNREVNTIGSKSCDADIAHLVVGIKEELERIREQIQNVE